MYKSILIKKFRGFQEFSLDSLGRINLIAGRNGIGKTALLEAFWLNRGYYNPELGIGVDNFRGVTQTHVNEFLWSLFTDFQVQREIVVETKDKTGYVRTIEIHLREPTEYERSIAIKPNQNAISGSTLDQEPTSLVTSQAILKSFDSQGRETIAFATIRPTPEGHSLNFRKAQKDPGEPRSIFLSSMRRSSAMELVERFSNLSIAKEEEVILNALKIIEPKLKRLTVEYRGGEPGLFGDFGAKRLMPLPLMGDGIYRLLTMALTIPEARDGEILIDEIENGLHYSVMPDVWNSLAKLAESFNTQLFATTHSEECIRAAAKAFGKSNIEIDERSDFLLHRLEKDNNGTVYPITYSLNDLVEALEMGLEVR